MRNAKDPARVSALHLLCCEIENRVWIFVDDECGFPVVPSSSKTTTNGGVGDAPSTTVGSPIRICCSAIKFNSHKPDCSRDACPAKAEPREAKAQENPETLGKSNATIGFAPRVVLNSCRKADLTISP